MANVKQIKINDTVYDVEDSVARSALEQKAPLESPALTGIPTAPTASNGTSTTQIATTAFVQNAVQGAGSSYTLPVASSTTLGGVKPVAKTASMTQEVGVDASGALYTEPGSGGGGTVTESDIENALGYKPIGAADVPVKKVNGATGEVKGTFYVTVTQGNGYIATADKTAAEVYAAYEAGYAVYAIVKFGDIHIPYTLPLEAAVNISGNVILGFGAAGSTNPMQKPIYLCVVYNGDDWLAWNGTLTRSEDIPTIPTELPNPWALNIKIGDTTTSYDGSVEKTVEIPKGGGTDASLGITGAAAGEFPKVSAVNENGAPTSWEAVEGVEATLGPVPLPAPATAAVGQIIKVKTVDESGKVTGTEAVDMPQGGGADISLGVTGAAVGQLVKISEVDADGKPTTWEAFDPAKWTKIGDTINITDAGFPVCMAFPDSYSELMVIGQLFVAESSKAVYAAITPGASNYSMQRIVKFDIGTHKYGTDFRIMAHNYAETETTIKISAEAYTSQGGTGFGSASATTKLKSMQKTSVAAGTNGYISIFTENEIAITSGNIEVYAR